MTEKLLTALDAHNWYALAALLMLCFIQVWKHAPLASLLYQKVPDGWRWAPPIVLAYFAGFTEAFLAGDEWRAALLRGVSGIIFIALPAMGAHAGVKELGRRGGSALLLLLLPLVVPTVGCAGSLEQAHALRAKELSSGVVQQRDAERCDSLDSRRNLWGRVAKGGATMAGVAGVSSPLSEKEQLALGITAGVGAGIAIVATIIEQGADESWARECSGQ